MENSNSNNFQQMEIIRAVNKDPQNHRKEIIKIKTVNILNKKEINSKDK